MPLVNRTIDFISKNKTTLVIINSIVILLFSIVIFRNFIFTNEWPAGGDVMGWISASYTLKDFRWLYVWRQYSFGSVQEIKSIDFMLWLGYSLFRDSAVTVKVFMFASFLVSAFSMYFLAYHFTRRHLASFSASMIYTLNQWIFSQYTEAHLGIIFGYALAPLLFLLLDRALKNARLHDILLLALGLAVFVTGSNPLSVLIIGVFLIMFVIFYFLSEVKTNLRSGVKRFLKTVLTVGVFLPLLASFWLVPVISNVTPHYISSTFQYPIDSTYWSVAHWSYPNMRDAFTLRAVESWGYKSLVEVYTGLGLPGFPVYLLLSFIFILAYCTVFIWRNRYTLFFAISTLISMFISKGPQAPFGSLFVWAWSNVPFFAVFRVPSRWAMMIALSHAFFVALMVSLIERYIEKREHLTAKEILLRFGGKISDTSDAIRYSISIDIPSEIVKKVHKFLYYFTMVVLILTLLSGPIASFFFLNHGLQCYTYPQEQMEPYRWIAEHPGDYKIVTVGQAGAFSNFEISTDLGFGHDLGYESSFIHDKPVLQDGGWSQLPHNFVDYLWDIGMRPYMTQNSFQILGTLNYKYTVLPSYTSDEYRTFFLNQKGGEVVFNTSSVIIENKFFTPQIFSSTENVIVIGGLESFWPLSKIDSFNFSRIPIIFPQWVDKSFSVEALLNESNGIIFVDSDVQEMVMLLLSRDVNFVNVAEYGYPSWNSSRYWIPWDGWRKNGKLVLGGETLSTVGKNIVNIPFSVPSNEIYDIWMRVAFAPNRGNLTIYVDSIPIEEIRPMSDIWTGPKWVNITRLNLKSGSHVMTLQNDGTGSNDVDTIAAIKPDLFQSKMNDLTNTLQGFPGRIIYVFEAENSFEFPEVGSIYLKPFEGRVLHTEGLLNVSPEGTASASSFGVWDNIGLDANGANDDDIDTRWASNPQEPMPQWLQVEWKTPQELIEARVVFEQAYAEDYTIQTWNGTNWINQVSVEGNTDLNCVHIFEEPVKTDKLRIVTTRSAHAHVSIREFEAITLPWISTNFSTLVEDQYMFAFRLVQNQNQETLFLKVDDETFSLRHVNTTEGIQWYEGGPVDLNPGNHLLKVGTDGKIDYDQMIIYSLEDEEKIVSLDDFRIHSEELGWNVSPKGTASASSFGVWDNIGLDANGANDDDIDTRWASNPQEPMPQWLQVEWKTPQELNATRIFFEQAYAKDYTIQTWNGTNWINQVSVEGNTDLNCVHIFEEPVKTDKLRIVTTRSAHAHVSIREFEAYTESAISRSVLIPEDGWYRVNFRIAFGPEYGTLNLKVNDETIAISCNSSDTEIKHYEVGPFYLNAGEQNVDVRATGRVEFGDMAMTLNDEGDFGFLHSLFEAPPGPQVNYEKINPGKYEAHVENSNEPFILIFSESYHPMWKAYIDGEEILSIPVYSMVNGFYINKTGNFDVTIYFTGQTYADFGLKISMITLIIVVAILIIPSKKLKQWGEYIKQKIFREKAVLVHPKTKGGQL